MNVAVIPARGGSKRIPRKNVRAFAGRPMIEHSITCALESGLFAKVLVSTDDAEIAGIARRAGADVPFERPAGLSDDTTATTPVLRHAVDYMLASGDALHAVCCIYATAPFLQHGDLARGLALLKSGDWQYVFAATRFAYPVFRSFQKRADGSLEMFFPEHFGTRSQDLPEAWHDAGQFYWGRPSAWTTEARIFDRHSTVVPIPHWRVQDIDTEEDWVRAEAMARCLWGFGHEL